MAITSTVIEVNSKSAEEAQDSINEILQSLAIASADFLFALTIKYEQKNQTAQIVIFYNA